LALAEYWIANGITFDQVYTGTLVRQQRTEQVVASAMPGWPPAQSTVAWNEYDAQGVLARFVPALADRDERFAELVRNFEQSRDTPEQNRHFQRMFEVAMALWLDGGIDVDGVEPFHAFKARVTSVVAAVTAPASSRRTVVFTSGGPIGLMVQQVLKAPDRSFLEVNWRVKNCSVSEFVFGAGRISLDSFNSVAHLPRNLQTFR
jgi:broad specificity phosphatase PhoE